MTVDIAIFGGGASGFFTAAIAAASSASKKIIVFEKTDKSLSKVKISGGGRCNLTHACFDQKELVKHYPRGEKELLGAFHSFMTYDTISWFEDRGVKIKTEIDGRMFPESNSSQTIIDCLTNEINDLKVKIEFNKGLVAFEKINNAFLCTLSDGTIVEAKKIVICTGSNTAIWEILKKHHIKLIEPVPSLFTFNIKNKRFNDLMGLTLPNTIVKIKGFHHESTGPLLFTHWGLSGPVILKLSAFAARFLHDANYIYTVEVNFTGIESENVFDFLMEEQKKSGHKTCRNLIIENLPKRLYEVLMDEYIYADKKLAEISKTGIKQLHELLTAYKFEANGKTTFKEEFVTCGGVDLKDVNMKTMESKTIGGLYFAGECLNIDAITGGFNFQAAWTTGYLAGKNAAI